MDPIKLNNDEKAHILQLVEASFSNYTISEHTGRDNTMYGSKTELEKKKKKGTRDNGVNKEGCAILEEQVGILLDLVMNNIMTQWIKENTRFRGNEEPSRLDLLLTNELEVIRKVKKPMFTRKE